MGHSQFRPFSFLCSHDRVLSMPCAPRGPPWRFLRGPRMSFSEMNGAAALSARDGAVTFLVASRDASLRFAVEPPRFLTDESNPM